MLSAYYKIGYDFTKGPIRSIMLCSDYLTDIPHPPKQKLTSYTYIPVTQKILVGLLSVTI